MGLMPKVTSRCAPWPPPSSAPRDAGRGRDVPRWHRRLVGALLAGLLLALPVLTPPGPAAAQTATIEELPVPIGESGQDYARAVRGEGIDTDIRYLADHITIEPPVPEPQGLPDWLSDSSALFWLMIVVFAVMLLVTTSIGARYGGLPTATIESRPQDRARPRRSRASGSGGVLDAALDGPERAFPGDFLRIEDRRLALILLLNQALERTAEANGVPLMRSQTARGVLRALPQHWAHLPALQRLVREEELVRFGGRDIPEALFADCIEIARPLFGRGGRR